MKKYRFFQKFTSALLSLVLVVGMLPGVSLLATAADADADLSAAAVERVSDPSTMNEWMDYFGPDVLSTEFAGGVWTDKSVFTDAEDFRAEITMDDEENNFLIALSAIAANQQLVGYSSTPLDVMLVLDVSGSMDNNNKDREMINAANQAIDALLSQNLNNRVGVVLYSGRLYQNQISGTDTATLILPLDHYTTTGTTTIGSGQNAQTIPAYLDLSNQDDVSVNTGVRDSDNNRVRTGDKNVSGGTYIQNGLYQAWGEFSKVTDTVVPAGNAQAGAQRTPVMVLLSDGQPTYATASYNNVGDSSNTYGNGGEASTTWQTVFLTQLTAAFVKGKMASHYNTTAKFYTLGLGTGTSQYATAVLNPTQTSTELDGYWNNFMNNDADANGNVLVKEDTDNRPGRDNSWSLYKDANVKDRNYVDSYELAENTDKLLDAFQNIVNTIVTDAGHVTLVEEEVGEDASGYITFTDELGVFMEVKDMKGLVLGEQMFTGEAIAKSLQEDQMGTQENPSDYGNEFIWTVKERLGITDTAVAQQLVIAAYADQQLYYDAATGAYSNYIGWYSDSDGNYLGFWDKDTGITSEGAPEGTTWINKSYGYLGTANDSDMMHVVVMLSTHIESGMQVVQYKIPASLIPTVTYKVELDGTDPTKMKNITRQDAFPLRLVYEVGLQEGINSVNVEQKMQQAIDEGWAHAHINDDGTYSFYTNLWGAEEGDSSVDYNDPLNHQVAQSHFHPAVGNDRYYYTVDTPVYVKNGDTYELYTGTAAPSGDGYYRAYSYYTSNGYTTEYLPTSEYAVNMAAAHGRHDDGLWYIPEGAIFQQLDRFHMKKSENTTETLEYYDYPVVVDLGDKYETYAFLGNNGRITITPAQGIKLTKTVTETVADAPETFNFTVTLSEAVAAPTVTDPDGKAVSGWSVSGNVITVQLKAGETVYITGLPTGVTYTVAEEVTKYYAASSTNATGTVEANTVHAVDFVNTPKGYGNLIVSKDVDHPYTNVPDALTAKQFPITVTLSGADVANKTFTVTGSASITSVTTDANGAFTVNLKDNESLTVVGLPEGTTFTTTETLDATNYKGFTMDADRSVLTGTIVKDTAVQTHVVNEYAPSTPTATISVAGTKTLVDEAGAFDWEGKSFTVRLEQYVNGAYQTLAETQVTEGSLSYAFTDQISLNAMGTYYYKVSEVIPEERLEGMSYDATIGRFQVVVTDNDVDGELEFTVTDLETGNEITGTNNVYTFNKDFVNTHTTDATYVEFTVNKDVTDPHNTGATEEGYLFALYEVVDGVTATTPAYSMRTTLVGGQGQTTFHIPITQTGERTFILKEVEPAEADKLPGMVYDDTQYTVKVGATAEDGKLVPYVNFSKDTTAVEEADLVFTNVIDLEPLILKPYVTKTISGRDPMEGDEFHFHVEQTDGSFVAGSMPGGYSDDLVVDYQILKNGGVAYYEEIPVTQVGTYYFRSTEIAGTAGGMTYDSSIYHITVNVTVVDGALQKDVSFVKVGDGVPSTAMDSVKFVNTYENTDTAEVTLGGSKVLTGRSLITGDFSFTLSENGKVLHTVSNLADGTFTFPTITYTVADKGTHTYTIAEVDEGKGGVKYDETTYTVTVTVTDNGKGELEVNTSGADSIQFNNTYSVTPTDLTLSGTKSWTNTDLNAPKAMEGGEFTFVLYASDSSWTKGSEVDRVTNTSSGSFSFDLDYDTAGERYYLLQEVIGDADGVSYDTALYRIKVPVYDTGVGTLQAVVSERYKVGVGNVSAITFGNLYTPAQTQVTLEGEKTLTGRKLIDGEFEFALYESNAQFTVSGDALQTVSNQDGKFTFEPISFTKTGTYYYVVKEVVPAEAENNVYDGVKYDTTQFGITVTVTDNGEGELVASHTVTGGTLKFTNEYTVDGVAYFSVSGHKTLENKALEADMFAFEMVDANGVRVALVRNDANGDFTFTDIPLTSLGDHEFTIREIDEGKGGITYDSKEYKVTVTASDDGKGGLTAGTPVITLGTATVSVAEFTNTYSVEPTELPIRVQKVMEGDRTTVAANEFTFQLMENGKVLQTKGTLAGGGVLFDAIEFTEAGEYTYTVSEVVPQGGFKDGVTYDTHTLTVKVTVTDNGDGTLTAEPTYEGLRRFTNTYEVTEPTSFDLSGTKVLNNKTLEELMFRFQLCNTKGDVIASVQNDENGGFLFEDIPLNSLGTHTFIVKEMNDGKGGITYDTREFTVKVEVKDNGKGGMFAEAPVVELNGVATSLQFTNTYTITGTASVDLNATKKLDGIRDLENGEFTFELKENGKVLQSVTNAADGTVDFEAIQYTKDDIGDHTYTISEVKGSKGGVEYDETVYTVTVTVSDNGEGGLSVTRSMEDSAIVFNNGYTVDDEKTVSLGGTKVLTGDSESLEDHVFSFRLKKGTTEVETVTSNTSGIFSFSDLTFTEADLGEHIYTVEEVNEGKGGIGYDPTVYTVKITVEDNLLGGITVTKTVDGSASKPVIFSNTYTITGTGSADFEAHKDLTGHTLEEDDFSFQLKENGKVLQTVKNDADGTVDFEAIEYTKADIGTHIYSICEVLPEGGVKDGITYDPTVYTVTVTVSDNGQGGLTVTDPVYTLDGQPVQALFTNTYAVTETTSFDLSGTKTLLGIKELTDDLFTFELYKDGDLVTSTANVGGTFAFTDIPLESLGWHEFTLVEQIPEDAVDNVKDGITYDDLIYTVKVNVTDNGVGGMQVENIDLYLGVVPVESVVFTNRYDVRGTSVTITGTKVFTGNKALEDNMFAFELLKNGERVALAQNVGDTFTFLNVPLDTLGEHNFTVRELIPEGAEDNLYQGITYCPEEYVVDVSLTTSDNGVGGMNVSDPVYTHNGQAVEGIQFTNSYDVYGHTTFTVEATKQLTGKELTDGAFTFDLYEGETLVASAANKGGKVVFADVKVDTLGEHVYTLSERKGDAKGVTYDAAVYTVTVNVVDNGDGTMSAETPVITLDGKSVASADFVNSYTPEEPPTEPSQPTETTKPSSDTPKTGDSSNPVVFIVMLGVSALGIVILLAVLVIGRKKGKYTR